MNPQTKGHSSLIVGLLTLVALGLLVAMFYSPIWWVSLTAPNYPPEAFPDGVRIHFHMNGVFNGCKKVDKAEIREVEALDCVHEMDTINHYVGMYPIAAGGVIERAFAPFLLSMLGIMLLGFATTQPKVRVGVLVVGFGAIGLWMYLTFFSGQGFRFQNEGYVKAMVTALDQEATAESAESLSPGQALLTRLKAEMAKSEAKERETAAVKGGRPEKEALIDGMRATFDKDQARREAGERMAWTGTGMQVLSWHYGKTLGRYFNNPEQIRPMVSKMTLAAHIVFWGILAAMALLVWGARRTGGLFYWLLVVVPIALPLIFVLDYSAWLWWYGHTLNDMGAFTVKAFMPTVFGDGKVAQFATHSYPSVGFGIMLGLSLVLAVAALIRRKQIKPGAA
jgi:hypothetical protein